MINAVIAILTACTGLVVIINDYRRENRRRARERARRAELEEQDKRIAELDKRLEDLFEGMEESKRLQDQLEAKIEEWRKKYVY